MFTLGCEVPEPPGELVGQYTFAGTQTTDSCLAFADQFRVVLGAEIRRQDDDSVAYWRVPGGETLSGSFDDGEYLFIAEQLLQQRGSDATIGDPGCALVRRDIIGFNLIDIPDGGVEPDAGVQSETGTMKISYQPTAQSDCSLSLAYNGGMFAALPCAVEYDLVVVDP